MKNKEQSKEKPQQRPKNREVAGEGGRKDKEEEEEVEKLERERGRAYKRELQSRPATNHLRRKEERETNKIWINTIRKTS